MNLNLIEKLNLQYVYIYIYFLHFHKYINRKEKLIDTLRTFVN